MKSLLRQQTEDLYSFPMNRAHGFEHFSHLSHNFIMTCANCMAATEMAWWQGSQDICTDRTEASVLSLVPAWWCLCLSVLCFMLFHGLSQQEHCGSNSVAILTPVPLWGRGGACSVEQRLCVSETHFSILQLLRQAWTKWEGWHKCCKQWLWCRIGRCLLIISKSSSRGTGRTWAHVLYR